MTVTLQKYVAIASVSLVAFVVAGAGAGLLGPVFTPLMRDLNWSNGETSSLATAYSLGGLFAAPVLGIAIDKYGARNVMSFGVLASASGFFSASRCHAWAPMLAAYTLAGIGVSASFYLPSAVVVASWMKGNRNLGMGIVIAAMSAGAAIFAPLAAWWTENYGWRSAVASVAALIALTLPLILTTIRTAPSHESWNVGAEKVGAPARAKLKHLKSAAFVTAIASGALAYYGLGGVQFHVIPILVQAGFSAHSAGVAFGGTWLLSGIGSLALGVVADRCGTRAVLALALIACAGGTLTLVGASDSRLGILCATVFVVFWGLSANSFGQLAPAIFAERFGAENLGAMMGLLVTVGGVTGALAPLGTGLLYDRSGAYVAAIVLSASTTFAAALLILLLGTLKPINRIANPLPLRAAR